MNRDVLLSIIVTLGRRESRTLHVVALKTPARSHRYNDVAKTPKASSKYVEGGGICGFYLPACELLMVVQK